MYYVQNVRGNFTMCCQRQTELSFCSAVYSVSIVLAHDAAQLALLRPDYFRSVEATHSPCREHEYWDLRLIDWETLYRGSTLLFGMVREDNNSSNDGRKTQLCTVLKNMSFVEDVILRLADSLQFMLCTDQGDTVEGRTSRSAPACLKSPRDLGSLTAIRILWGLKRTDGVVTW